MSLKGLALILFLAPLLYSCVGEAKKGSTKLNQDSEEVTSLLKLSSVSTSTTVEQSTNTTASTTQSAVSLKSCLLYVSHCDQDLSVSTGLFYPLAHPDGGWNQNSCLDQANEYYNRCHTGTKSLQVVSSYYEDGVMITENKREYLVPNSSVMVQSTCSFKINTCPKDPSYIKDDTYYYFTNHSANTNLFECEKLVSSLVSACNVDDTKLLNARSEFRINGTVYQSFTASNQSTYKPTIQVSTGGSSTTTPTSTTTTTTTSTSTGTSTTTSTTSTSTSTTSSTGSSSTKTWWKPGPINSWDIRLDGGYGNLKNVEVYTVDLFDVPKSTITSLRNKGTKVICYFSAGTFEDWRSDKSRFPSSVKGKNLDDWPGEKWLDVRKISTLKPIMQERMDLAVSKGCHAIDPDNVDGYTQDSGFSIKSSDQLAYNKMLAEEAHQRGLAIGLKNDLDQIKDLEPYFDFAVNEQCFQYNECHKLDRFIQKGKAVFGIEYELSTGSFCSKANSKSYDFIKKRYDLDSWIQSCR